MLTNEHEARLIAIEDRFAILDLEAEYAYGWDFGSPLQWAEGFTVDGIFEMLPAGNMPLIRVVGRTDLEAFCLQIRNNWNGRRWSGLHFMHPPRLKIRGNCAESLIFFEFRHVMQASENAHTQQGVTAGYYRTNYLRTLEGWRIQQRTEQVVSEELAHFYPSKLPTPQLPI